MGEQVMMSIMYVRAQNNARARLHYARHKERCVSRSAAWRAENPEYVAAYQKQYNADNIMTKRRKRVDAYARDPEAGRAAARDYAARHPDRVKATKAKTEAKHGERLKEIRRQWKQDNRETVNRQRREWVKLNPEKDRIHGHNFRARKRALPNTLTLEEWRGILDRQSNACCYCGDDSQPLEMEHLMPSSLGGGTTKENIAGACKSCNSAKRDMTVIEFVNRGAVQLQQ